MSLAVKVARAQAAGDPGLLGDIFGGVAKFVGGAAKAAVGVAASAIPGPVGGIIRSAGQAVGLLPSGAIVNGQMRAQPGAVVRGGRTLIADPRTAAKIKSRLGMAGLRVKTPVGLEIGGHIGGQMIDVNGRPVAAAPGVVGAGIGCPSGYRPNKSGYFLKSTGEYVAPGTKCVKVRRRNPGNMRALDRAVGRIESAKRMSGRLSRITVRKKCS